MDPDKALLELCEAAFDGDADAFEEAAENLRNWLERGGFAPSCDELIEALETDEE
jgi:hypothetical protein